MRVGGSDVFPRRPYQPPNYTNTIRRDAFAKEEALCAPVPEALCSSDRKSTRLNSSHSQISYAVFCLKKKEVARQRADKYLKQLQLLERRRGIYVWLARGS